MIKIIDNFCNNPDLLDELYYFFYYGGQWQFDFFSHKYVWANKHNSDIEDKICRIIKQLSSVEPKFLGVGYEPWINVLDKDNNHLPLHVDCEEAAEKEIKPAKITATLYLGSEEELEGGDLVLDTESYAPYTEFYENIFDLEKEVQKNEYNNWVRIPYKYNRLILFDSNYAHAVLPIKGIKKGTSRITLTISAWDRKIMVKR